MNSMNAPSDLSELILRKLDGSITDQQLAKLFRYLESNPEAIDSYVELTLLYSCLSEAGGHREASDSTGVVSEEEECDLSLKALGEYEQQALPLEVVPVTAQKPEIVSLDKSMNIIPRRKINKASLYTMAASLAALVLMIVYVNLFPVQNRESVAVIVDSVDAKWANDGLPTDINSNLKNIDGIRNLLRGCVKVQFFGGAEVIIEGPAEIEFKSFDSMDLNSGRLYAAVPGRASGFTVNTPCSQIVDIGTEFGVKVDFDGTSDLHMFKGHASISVSGNSQNQLAKDAFKGQALRVNPSLDQIQEIQVNQQMFARHISSGDNLIWRGDSIDLANLASGGDGLSKWGKASAIDPRTGQPTQRIHDDRQASNAYVPVPWNRYIDGVFVPDGQLTQIVTSQNHQFTECPSTNNIFCEDIIVNQVSMDPQTTMVLRGVNYGTPDHPGIFMHANLGITFDLAEIRQLVSDNTDLIFRSEIGISEMGADGECDADFWVLVDGEIRYQKRNVQTKGSCGHIELKLHTGDRFLTLITTDGQNPLDTPQLRQTESDWCIFAGPVLAVE